MPRRTRKRERPRSSLKKKRITSVRGTGTPGFWAVLTVLAFPIALWIADAAGLGAVWSFILAILASTSVLAAEILIRGRIWLFEDAFAERFHHPDMPKRLFLVTAGTLLILESALIIAVAVDRRLDNVLLALVHRKECTATADPDAQSLCRFLQGEKGADMTSAGQIPSREDGSAAYARRAYAASAWFPAEPLVTCADRLLDTESLAGTTRFDASLMMCTSWRMDTNGILRVNATRTAFTGARMERGDDRLYLVEKWSDDPHDASWTAALGDIADRARRRAVSIAVLDELRTVLFAESLGRAQSLLRK